MTRVRFALDGVIGYLQERETETEGASDAQRGERGKASVGAVAEGICVKPEELVEHVGGQGHTCLEPELVVVEHANAEVSVISTGKSNIA